MVVDNWINNKIDEGLLAENADHEAKHEPSGKLSASMLYMPVRYQIFKLIGVPKKPMEAYVLGKFKRGNDVEDWYVGQIEKHGALIERQKQVEYRGCIGFVDAVVDSDKMLFKQGDMPHEVKSVTNAKLKRIATTGTIDWHYQLQACLYALALKSKYYAVDIVSAEDLRPNVYIFETQTMAREVDKAIDAYDKAVKDWKEKQLLPKFEPNINVPWTDKPEYAPFSEEWLNAPDEEVLAKLVQLKGGNV
jgi:hypothetical protein